MRKLWDNKAAFWALVGVMVCALALRLWALNWGLPYLYDHDETIFVTIAQHIVKTGDLNPHYFDYGSILFYLNALVYVPYYLAGSAAGILHNPNDIPYPVQLTMGVGITSVPGTYLLGRSVTLVFGMASVYMVFLIGRRVTGNLVVGVLAAFMIAISPTCVVYSRLVSPNMLLVFFILLVVWGAIKTFEKNSTGAYVLAGVAAGLVASTKYNGVLVLGVVALACLLRGGWRGLMDWRLLMMLGLSAITFLATTPFALFDYQTFITEVRNQAIHYSTGHAGMEGDTVAWYAGFLLTQEGLVTVLSFAGAAYAGARGSAACDRARWRNCSHCGTGDHSRQQADRRTVDQGQHTARLKGGHRGRFAIPGPTGLLGATGRRDYIAHTGLVRAT